MDLFGERYRFATTLGTNGKQIYNEIRYFILLFKDRVRVYEGIKQSIVCIVASLTMFK
jgi:hypothetical protein